VQHADIAANTAIYMTTYLALGEHGSPGHSPIAGKIKG
jgi:hypothetical protein